MNTLRSTRPRASLRQGRTDWYSIKNAVNGVADVMIYDEIGFFGVTASDFVRDLKNLTTDKIELHISSPGGEVFDGMAIYAALKNHPAQVHVIVDSLAASIASVIAMAGDKVTMARNATMMIHDGHGLCVGNAKDMADMVALLDRTSDNIASVYAERAGGSAETWRGRMRAETWYTAEEAVQAGLADEIQGQESKTENSWDLSIFNYSGRDSAPAPVIEATPEPEPFTWSAEAFRAAMEGAKK